MAIAVFVFVLVVFNVIKEVAGPFASGQITEGMFVYLIAITIPGVLPYALPLGLLTAILLVLGRLSAQNEIVAMKAAGLSLWRITAPVFLLALLGVGLSAVINIYYAPIADTAFRSTLQSAARADPLRFFSPRTFVKNFPGYVIFADRREGNELRQLHVWELDDQSRAIRHLQGQRAELSFDEANPAIVLTVHDAHGQVINPDLPPSDLDSTYIGEFKRSEFRLPLDDLLGGNKKQTKLAFMTLDELLQRRAEAIADKGEGAFERRIELQTAIQKKFSFSFAVLSLALVAIPLGIKASRTETYANFALALALALGYFMVFILCSWLEKMPAMRPDLMIWVPNFLFQALGGILFWRACKR
ncbi:LPS export ABC transporter permease LptF [Cerasicoccus arenae]|uniref:LPS export ABC transporter permease LptF n=2 Tax=Cerasicoccus arenae TaxID=424488 RepID=A0A8J3GBR3_9BACT|nr:LPS export ABC transporter permease LptF [Cerasicoccus arenae]